MQKDITAQVKKSVGDMTNGKYFLNILEQTSRHKIQSEGKISHYLLVSTWKVWFVLNG